MEMSENSELNERQNLPPTKSNATLKAVISAAGVCFVLGVGATIYLSELLTITKKDKKEEITIASQKQIVKPQYEQPKQNTVANILPAIEKPPEEAKEEIKFSLPKREEIIVEKKEKGLFDHLLPEIEKKEEKKDIVVLRPSNSEPREHMEPKIDEGHEKWKQDLYSPFENLNSSTSVENNTLENKSSLQTKLSPTVLEKRVAGKMKDLTYTLPEGSIMPCVLNTAINTNVPGYLKCVITDNIYGYDGNQVLVPKGSQVHGEYNKGLSLGIDRLFVKWSRLRTADGIVISLDSPGVGSLGEAGLGGKIDHRYFRRFGGALLISLINDSVAEDGNGKFKNTRDKGQEASEEIIEQYSDIPPILYKNQGEETIIYVAKDLSFKEVYDE